MTIDVTVEISGQIEVDLPEDAEFMDGDELYEEYGDEITNAVAEADLNSFDIGDLTIHA